jgi:hypothetical protein
MKKILLYVTFTILIFTVFACGETDPIVGKWKPTSGKLITNGVESQEMRAFEEGHFIYFHSNGDYRSEKKGEVTEEGSWERDKDKLETKTRLVGDKQERVNTLTIKELTDKKMILFQGTPQHGAKAVFERAE